MKAVIIDQPNSFKVIEVDPPTPAADEVLVKVCYCGICATDFDIYKGLEGFINNVNYPVRIGHEWSGIVENVGQDVKDLKAGDRVAGDGKITCGCCEACRRGNWGKCKNIRSVGTVGDNWAGALAEYIVMPERNIYKLPDQVSLKEGAVIEPAAIALNALIGANVGSETSVAIIGTGPIGLAAVGLAKALGSPRVFLVGRKDAKLEIGRQMGADVIINTTRQDLEAFIEAQTQGQKADVVVETSGSIDMVYQSINNVGKMGVVSLVGFYDKNLDDLDVNSMVLNKVSLVGASGTNECFPKVIDYLKHRQIDLSLLVTQEFDFDQIGEVFDVFKQSSDQRIKVMVRINEGR